MSARNVWSGTVPSEYCSARAMSAPPKRPDTWVLIPLAPFFIALVIACFCTRRNEARFSNWRAIFSATKRASISIFLISITLMCTFLSVKVFNLLRSFSISEPPLPITIPGLPVWIAILMRFAARSISTWETDASFNSLSINLRIFKSSCKSEAKSFSAYHFASQSRITPTRSPIGLIFWPTVFPP